MRHVVVALFTWIVTAIPAQAHPAQGTGATVTDATGSLPRAAEIDQFIRAEMARQRIPGVGVAVVNKGKVSARGYGFANVELVVPVTDETIFQSGSLGKMFTAAAVMLQVAGTTATPGTHCSGSSCAGSRDSSTATCCGIACSSRWG